MSNDATLPALPGFSGVNASGAYNLAAGMVGQASSFAAILTGQAGALIAPTITPNFPTIANAPTPATASQPTLQTVAWNVPAQPTAFSGSVGNLVGLLPGPFVGAPPVLNFPAAPGPFNTPVPAQPTTNLAFTYPTVSVTLPAVPSLMTLDTVVFNPLVIPTFSATVPTLTVAAPTITQFTEPAPFTSALLTQAQTDLTNAITSGTWTGLPAAAQQALQDAASEREYLQQANAIADLARMETLGYMFPPGAYNDSRIKLQTELSYKLAGLSRDIFAEQAKLTLENIIKARELVITLESKLIDQANNVANRAFETAKYITQSAVALYNAQVESYKASLDGYRTMAVVYETQIKGIEVQIEQLKAQIDFEHVKAEINTQLVHQYKAEVEASEAVLEIYKTQVEIIQTQANVEKIKVDIYGAEIQAFVGQINAYTAQVEAYKAGAETQGIIESAYKTQVEAYTATVQAGVAQINANVDVFKAQIAAYQAQLSGYDSAIKGMVGQAQAAAEYNTAQAEVYKAAIQAITSYNGTLTMQWQAILNEQEKIAEVGIAAAKANGDLYIAARGLSIDASKVAAQVSAQLGAAALGAVHWSTSLSASVSASNSSSDSTVQSSSA